MSPSDFYYSTVRGLLGSQQLLLHVLYFQLSEDWVHGSFPLYSAEHGVKKHLTKKMRFLQGVFVGQDSLCCK